MIPKAQEQGEASTRSASARLRRLSRLALLRNPRSATSPFPLPVPPANFGVQAQGVPLRPRSPRVLSPNNLV